MRQISDDLFEYDRPTGRLQNLLHRLDWRWIIAGIMGLAFAVPFLLTYFSPHSHSPRNNLTLSLPPIDETDNESLVWREALSMSDTENLPSLQKIGRKLNSKTGSSRKSSSSMQYNIAGDDPISLMNITNLEGLTAICASGESLNTISLTNVYLEAAEFTKALEGCTTLETITLENVWLIGNFSRVHLPNLKRFTYVQNGNDKRDSYKSPESLKQTLFFDKNDQPGVRSGSSPSWTVEKDLLNLGVEISVWKAGTKLIDIQRQKGEIYLNVKYCENVLVNVKGSFDSLTLINCNVTDESIPVIPSTLKYLNLRNAVQRSPTLDHLIKKLTNLEEFYVWLSFHCDWPGYELYLNLNNLPQTLKRLGTNNVDTTYSQNTPSALSVTELTIGSYITNKTISDGLPKLFTNLEWINVVNVSDPSPAAGYSIIHQAIKMKVKTIAVVHLQRNYSVAIENQTEILEVETILDEAGFLKNPLSCFILELRGVSYTARELTENERNEIRFKGLGFDKMDTWEDYLKWDKLQ